jgi:hypothetical protein
MRLKRWKMKAGITFFLRLHHAALFTKVNSANFVFFKKAANSASEI